MANTTKTQPEHIYRARFRRDIVAEFLPPEKNVRQDKVIILCDGLPAVPAKSELIRYLSKKGYWVFHPRYRGTWESAGRFLRQSPVKDIYDVIEELQDGEVTELYAGKTFEIEPKKIFLIGSSFGGAVALSASLHQDVDKVVALSPVVDFTDVDQGENASFLQRFTKQAFGSAYRGTPLGWQKLAAGQIMNPVTYAKKYEKKKIFIVHSRDDDVVHYGAVEDFANDLKCDFWLLRSQGHMSASVLADQNRIFNRVKKFLT